MSAQQATHPTAFTTNNPLARPRPLAAAPITATSPLDSILPHFFWKSLADLRKPPNGQNPMLSYGPPVLRRGDSKLPASHAHSAMLEAAYLLSVAESWSRGRAGLLGQRCSLHEKGAGGGEEALE